MTTRDMEMMQQRGTMSFLGEAMTMIWTDEAIYIWENCNKMAKEIFSFCSLRLKKVQFRVSERVCSIILHLCNRHEKVLICIP
jgi:hypothetical protein